MHLGRRPAIVAAAVLTTFGGAPAAAAEPVDPRAGVLAFGAAAPARSAAMNLASPVVGLAATTTGGGYWEVTADGDVHPWGDARSAGSLAGVALAAPVVGAAADPDGAGYWLVAADGGVFAFDAPFHGSAGGLPLQAPVVAVLPTPAADGYHLVAADGGVFAYGDAAFVGSLGGVALVAPVVGGAAVPAGDGYWLVAADGGVFAYGDAGFSGSLGGLPLAAPVVGMAAAPGAGYWLAGADGGVFAFDAPFHGSASGAELGDTQVAGIAAAAGGAGYWLALGPVPAPHDRPWWLGTRPLPPGSAELALATPPELVDRRFAPPPGRPELPRPAGGAFAATVVPVPADVVARSTWTPACPVALDDLRYVTVSFWGFDDRAHTGELLVHRSAAEPLVGVFRRLFDARYPIEEMRVLRADELDAPATGDDNITSGLECRRATGGTSWSAHAYGLAVDVNPFHNPYLRGRTRYPALTGAYLDRGRAVPGIIRAGDVVTTAFADIGWGWGGAWTTLKDWMHFSASGR